MSLASLRVGHVFVACTWGLGQRGPYYARPRDFNILLPNEFGPTRYRRCITPELWTALSRNVIGTGLAGPSRAYRRESRIDRTCRAESSKKQQYHDTSRNVKNFLLSPLFSASYGQCFIIRPFRNHNRVIKLQARVINYTIYVHVIDYVGLT